MNVTINVTVTGAPDKADVLLMDETIAAENAVRAAAGGALPQLPNSNNVERRTSYAAIRAQQLISTHLARSNTLLEQVNAGPLAKQVRQAAANATNAQLLAALTALTT